MWPIVRALADLALRLIRHLADNIADREAWPGGPVLQARPGDREPAPSFPLVRSGGWTLVRADLVPDDESVPLIRGALLLVSPGRRRAWGSVPRLGTHERTTVPAELN